MKRKGMPIGEATAATSIRTILAALMLFTLTPIILWAEPGQFPMVFHRQLAYGLTGFACLYLLGFFVILFRHRMIKRLLFCVLHGVSRLRLVSRSRSRMFYRHVSREMDLFSKSFKHYFVSGPIWGALSVVFTALFLLLLFSFSIVLVKALGYRAPVLTVLAYQVVVTFFMYFAPTPGAAGVAEGGYGLLFAQLVHARDVAVLTLCWRFLTIYIGVMVGILIMYWDILRRKKAVLR